MNGLLAKNASESARIATLPIGTYREIPLTQGKVAIVDPEDYEWLNQWKWYAHAHGKRWYAERINWNKGKPFFIRMHRVIMNTPVGMETDHIDMDGLNNQRSNLRVCTRLDNIHNQKARKLSDRHPFKGVYQKGGKWVVRIRVNRKEILVGSFKDKVEAAHAYDNAARKYHGEFARTNFAMAEGKE